MRKIALILVVPLTLLLSGCNYQSWYYYDSYRYSTPYYGWNSGYYGYGYYGDRYRYRYGRPYNYGYNRYGYNRYRYNRPYPRAVAPIQKERPGGFMRPPNAIPKERGGIGRPMPTMRARPGGPIRNVPGGGPMFGRGKP